MLRIARDRLNAEQRDRYHAHFCSGCHALRSHNGLLSSILTNYDQTVLSLVLGGYGSAENFDLLPCTAVPIRKVEVQRLSPAASNYLAAVTVALAGAKVEDDVDDEGGLKHKLARRLLADRVLTAQSDLRSHGFPVSILKELPTEQRECESDVSASLDCLVRPTAEMLGQVFAFGGTVTGQLPSLTALRQLGEALGEFVYLWDAVVDRDADLRKRRFNALSSYFAQGGNAAQLGERLRECLHRCHVALGDANLEANADILSALLESMRARVSRELGRPIAHTTSAASQRGDCDCCACGEACSLCDCSSCDACEGCCSCCDILPCDCFKKRKKRKKRGGSSTDPLPPVPLESFVGQEGVASTALTPAGRVRVADLEFEARAKTSIRRGAVVRLTECHAGQFLVVPA